MSRYVLTAQLKLQAPTNTRQVVNQMQGQLGNLSVPIQVSGAGKATKQIKQVTAATNQATSAANNMGKSFGLALKRFAAFTVASRAVSLFTNTMANATQEAIDFQREVVKISQVTGKSVSSLKGLNQEITRLATSLGTSSKELLGATRILAQAGIQAGDLKIALEALAKTTLAPTFEDISKTAEGAVAILAQFGKGVGALKEQLGAINAVAGQFAVESGDLIGAIRRTGGVFKAAGGSLNEFLGLFTSIRATTRESAESIATGLRTILTRIQRPATIQYLKELGVSLTDLNGRFVGPFEAVKRLSKALGDVPAGDLRFIQIAEQLGGFRQIGKVIPLLQEFETAEKARQAAVAGASSLDKDAATAQQALAVQIQKTKEEFLALVRGLTETSSFQIMVKTTLGLANAFIQVADALKPLIPLIGAFAAIKFAKGIGSFGKGIGSAIAGAQAKNQGGRIMAFAKGGMVPGSGNRDTVPAMLQPGEFVIRKSSVKQIGANNLANMNVKGYKDGGQVIRVKAMNPEQFGALTISGDGSVASKGKKLSAPAADKLRPRVQPLLKKAQAKNVKGMEDAVDFGYNKGSLNNSTGPVVFNRNSGMAQWLDGAGRKYATKKGNKTAISRDMMKDAEREYAKTSRADIAKDVASRKNKLRSIGETDNFGINLQGPFPARQIGGSKGGLESKWGKKISSVTKRVLKAGVRVISKSKMVKELDVPPINTDEGKLFNYDKFLEGAQESVEGFMLEGIIGALTNAKIGGGGTNFDFPDLSKKAQKQRLKRLFLDDDGFIDSLAAADAKRQLETAQSGDGGLYNKAARDPRLKIALANKGGVHSGKDTVPALLTPGEFVINRKSAQSIGYSNLSNMNKKGVTGFNKGGPVQMLNKGGGVSGGGGGGMESAFFKLSAISAVAAGAIGTLGDKSKNASDTQASFTIGAERAVKAIQGLVVIGFGLRAYNKTVDSFFDGLDAKEQKKADAVENALSGEDIGSEVATSVESALSSFSIDNATITIQKAKKAGKGGGGDAGEQGASTGSKAKAKAQADSKLQEDAKKEAKAQKKVENATNQQAASKAEFEAAKQAESAGQKAVDTQRDEVTSKEQNAKKRKQDLETAEGVHQTQSTHRDQAKKENDSANREAQKAQAEKGALQQEQRRVDAESTEARGDLFSESSRQYASEQAVAQNQGKYNKEKNLLQGAEASEAKKNAKIDKDLASHAKNRGNLEKKAMTQEKGSPERKKTEAAINKIEQREYELTQARSKNSEATAEQRKETVVAAKALRKSKGERRSANKSVEDSVKKVKKVKKANDQLGASFKTNAERIKKAESAQKTSATALTEANTKLTASNTNLGRAKRKSDSANNKLSGSQKKLSNLQEKQGTLFDKVTASGKRFIQSTRILEGKQKNLAKAQKETGRSSKGLSDSLRKGRSEWGLLRKGLRKSSDGIKKAGRGLSSLGGAFNKNLIRRVPLVGRSLANLNSKGFKLLNRSARKADIQFRKLSRSISSSGNAAGRGGGGGFASKAGRGVAKGAGFAVAGLAIAQQIGSAVSGAISEIAARRQEQAEGKGDIKGAAGNAAAGAMSEGLGRAFSFGGIAEIIGDSMNGTNNFASGVIQSVQNARATSASAAFGTRTNAAFTEVEEGRADFGQIAEGVGRSSAEALAEINNKTKSGVGADEKTRNEALKVIKDAERKTASGVGEQAGSMQELVKEIDSMGNQTALTKDQLLRLAKNAFAAAEAQRAVAKANFDNLKVMSAFNKANLGVNQFINSLKTGSSTLADSIATVEAAATNMNMGGEGSAALESIRKRIISVAAGGDETTAQGQAINRQFSRADAANDFMGSIQGRISGLDLNQGSAEAASQQLESALLAGVQDADIQSAISAQIAGMGDVRNKDVSGIIAQVSGAMGPLREGALNAAKALLQHEQTIVQLTAQRRQAEVAYIAAQRQAIDQQLQFAKSFEEFGGAKLTADQKLSANIAKFNLGARDAGVSELRTGSVQDIQNVGATIQNRLNQQQVQRATGGFRDVEGVDADRIKETNSAIQSLTGFIQSQIQATKEQIAVIERRNKQEQDSINSLLKGDISGFIEGQGATGAASALRSGDAELASMFSPAAQAAALEQLKSEGADTATLQRAGEIAASSVGLDARAGQVLTGTTDELNELKATGQALAQAGAEVSQMAADSAAMEIAQAEMAIENANLIFKQSMDESGRAQERAEVNIPGLRKGGTVYANRGIFVPRGTDTVPAMLTPGEFVVNRAAVQRGNNLQILRAMNSSGQTVNAGANSAANLSGGGSVGYYALGDVVQNLGGIFGQALPNLENIFKTFTDAVQTLSTTQIGVTVSKPIDVNVRLLNDNILSVIDTMIKDVVLDTVAQEIPKYKSTGSGQTTKSESLLNK